jgi:hypothetical protein
MGAPGSEGKIKFEIDAGGKKEGYSTCTINILVPRRFAHVNLSNFESCADDSA